MSALFWWQSIARKLRLTSACNFPVSASQVQGTCWEEIVLYLNDIWQCWRLNPHLWGKHSTPPSHPQPCLLTRLSLYRRIHLSKSSLKLKWMQHLSISLNVNFTLKKKISPSERQARTKRGSLKNVLEFAHHSQACHWSPQPVTPALSHKGHLLPERREGNSGCVRALLPASVPRLHSLMTWMAVRVKACNVTIPQGLSLSVHPKPPLLPHSTAPLHTWQSLPLFTRGFPFRRKWSCWDLVH